MMADGGDRTLYYSNKSHLTVSHKKDAVADQRGDIVDILG